MKAIFLLVLFLVNTSATGEIVIIKGQPTPLEFSNNFYYLPQTYVIAPEIDYIYITMDGINKICLLNESPSDIFEMVSHINILIHGIKTEWNCFPYITTIKEVRP
jgi:hypothetical protein